MKLSPKKNSFRISLGDQGETIAWNYLIQAGYRIIEKNFRCPIGEIDVVAKKAGKLAFVEIKTRSSERFGLPEESVGVFKQRKLIRLAQWYLQNTGQEDVPASFCVLSILWSGSSEPKICLIEDAFSADTWY